MKFIPHDYQAFTIEQMLEKKKLLTILDMGLG